MRFKPQIFCSTSNKVEDTSWATNTKVKEEEEATDLRKEEMVSNDDVLDLDYWIIG